MKTYSGSFRKKDGSIRKMLFAHLEDLPKSFLEERIIGSGSDKNYPDGMKLVWCLDDNVQNFRIFNYATQVGDIIEVDYRDDI